MLPFQIYSSQPLSLQVTLCCWLVRTHPVYNMGVIPTECPMHADYKPPTEATTTPPTPPAPTSSSVPLPAECPMSVDYKPTASPEAQVDPTNMVRQRFFSGCMI